jgi:cyclic 2,3-diphosphoglycerate synthase
VTRWGISVARERGYVVTLALLVGGAEKLDPAGGLELGVPVVDAAGDRALALTRAIEEHRPDGVLDLSDEPVLGYAERMELAAVALARGVPYLGPDFRLEPPVSGPPVDAPTVAILGIGKRTGKTAIGGETARTGAALGLDPILVAMGRGGPETPQVAKAGTVTLEHLLELVTRGEHAASDYLEDAVTSGVTTIGARRVGGGLAGAPMASNVREAAELAAGLGTGLLVLEGSGAAVPPIPWDAAVLAVPVTAPPEHLGGYLGPYRLLLSDLVVFTMAGSPRTGPGNLSVLRSHVQRLRGDARVVVTGFEPQPLGDVRDRDVFFTTTAPPEVAAEQVASLEANHGCRVVGWSANLADRARLARDMDDPKRYEVLLTELKAAAVDVACARALAAGAQVVFCDNRAVTVHGDVDLGSALTDTIELARTRRAAR